MQRMIKTFSFWHFRFSCKKRFGGKISFEDEVHLVWQLRRVFRRLCRIQSRQPTADAAASPATDLGCRAVFPSGSSCEPVVAVAAVA